MFPHDNREQNFYGFFSLFTVSLFVTIFLFLEPPVCSLRDSSVHINVNEETHFHSIHFQWIRCDFNFPNPV